MRIVVTFEAESAERLREQMLLFLGLQVVPAGQIDAKPVTATVVRKSKKDKAPAPAPEPPPPEPEVIDDDDADAEAVERALGLTRAAKEEDVTPEAEKAIELHKLKEQQLSRLRDLFNAGKGPFVRQLLAKYGNGAKVFPEVDAAQFPHIKVELDRELGTH